MRALKKTIPGTLTMKKRRMPPHIVLPDGRWRFVKKNRKSGGGSARSPIGASRRRKVKAMARRTRRYYGRRRGGGGRRGFGGMKSMLWPIAAGLADSYIDPMSPVDGLGATAIGFIGHDSTLKTLGLYKVGGSIGNLIPLPGRAGGAGGVMF